MAARRGHVLLLIALGLFDNAAQAQPRDPVAARALEHFERGKTHFQLARFDQAIIEFKKGYELKNDPIFLLNIAQCYRLKGPPRALADSQRAIFFYRQYLASQAEVANRVEIEGWIAELQKEVAQAREKRKKELADSSSAQSPPAGQPASSRGGAESSGPSTAGPTREPQAHVEEPAQRHRRRIRVGAQVGFSTLFFGADAETAPSRLGVSISGSYELYRERFAVDVGLVLTFNVADYDAAGGDDGRASVTSGLGFGRLRVPLSRRMAFGADLGLGTLAVGGLDEGNPWTAMAAAKSAVSFVNLRLGVGVDYQLTGRVVIHATPMALAYSPKTLMLRGDDADLDESVTMVLRSDFLHLGIETLF